MKKKNQVGPDEDRTKDQEENLCLPAPLPLDHNAFGVWKLKPCEYKSTRVLDVWNSNAVSKWAPVDCMDESQRAELPRLSLAGPRLSQRRS